MTIDPSTCKPSELCMVHTADMDAEGQAYGIRAGNMREPALRWHVLKNGSQWFRDDEVTVIRRAYQQPTDWETLRRAASLVARSSRPYAANKCRLLADHLEAEHTAAQEKAAADAQREKAVAAITDAYNEADGHFNLFELAYDALADAGYIAEVES